MWRLRVLLTLKHFGISDKWKSMPPTPLHGASWTKSKSKRFEPLLHAINLICGVSPIGHWMAINSHPKDEKHGAKLKLCDTSEILTSDA